jgi:phosphopantothenoylcysteine decarboxylase/phosphopantothenate--cysteine ligase
MHPADELRGVTSTILLHKRIVLAVTGSIAAVDTIRLARELIRNGADVIPVMTQAATRIIHPDALEFATSHKPITSLTGQAEHVLYCGKVKDPVDLLLISPCTANTLSKIAHGIDDTPVTTFATTALGSAVPITIVPSMHISMYQNNIIQQNIKRCKTMGIHFIDPHLAGNKAKLADTLTIINHVLRTIGTRDLHKKKILIIGGATAEPIDDVRFITNKSSGKTALALAQQAYEQGATITLWMGYTTEPIPTYLPTTSFTTTNNLQDLLTKHTLSSYHAIILCAAIADYQPPYHPGKIPSTKTTLTLALKPTPKLIHLLRKKAPRAILIGYKVEDTKTNLIQRATQLLTTHQLDYVIANTTSGFNTDTNEIWIIDKKGHTTHKKDTKIKLADHILKLIT